LERVDALAPGDAVLAVGGEDVVLRLEGAAGADLRGLLAEQLGPDAELAVTLERRRLDVDATGEDHVAEEPADGLRELRVVQVVAEGEVGMLDALTLGGQQLHELGAAVLVGGSEDLRQVWPESGLGHVCSSCSGLAGSPPACCRDGVRRVGGATYAGCDW